MFVSVFVPTAPFFARFGLFSLLKPTWVQLGSNLGPTLSEFGARMSIHIRRRLVVAVVFVRRRRCRRRCRLRRRRLLVVATVAQTQEKVTILFSVHS